MSLIKWEAAHAAPILAVAFSSDGSRYATASKDKLAKVFSLDSDTPVASFRGHTDRVNAVVFSPTDSDLLVTGSKDKTIKLFKVSTCQLLRTLRGHSNEILSLSISPDGRRIASGAADANVFIWSMESEQILKRLQQHAMPVTCVAFSPPGKPLLLSGSEDRTIHLWNVATGKVMRSFADCSDAVTCVRFCPLDPHLFVAGHRDASIGVWHLETQTAGPIVRLSGHNDVVTALCFARGGRILASCSADCVIKFWDVGTNTVIKEIEAHKNSISSCDVSPTADILVTGSWDDTVRLWDVKGLIFADVY